MLGACLLSSIILLFTDERSDANQWKGRFTTMMGEAGKIWEAKAKEVHNWLRQVIVSNVVYLHGEALCLANLHTPHLPY